MARMSLGLPSGLLLSARYLLKSSTTTFVAFLVLVLSLSSSIVSESLASITANLACLFHYQTQIHQLKLSIHIVSMVMDPVPELLTNIICSR